VTPDPARAELARSPGRGLSRGPQTLNEMLARAARDPQTGLRLVDRAERATWHPWPAIQAAAVACAGGLQELGVQPGDRVALILPTSIEFVHGFFGALLAGAVPVPLYPPFRLGRLDEYYARTARMLELAGVRLVLSDRRVRRLLGPALAPVAPAFGCRRVDELPVAPLRRVAAAPEQLALVQYSSGTTRDPLPVALSQRAVVAQVQRLNAFWPPVDGVSLDSGVSWLPLYHDMGLIGCVLPALERPGTLTLIPPEDFLARPALWLRTVSRYRATLSPAPNFAYGLCVDRIADDELDGVDLSCWRVALNGAEPVAPRVLRAFAERFQRWGFRSSALTPVYGLSEAALAVTFSDLDQPFRVRCFDRSSLAADGVALPCGDGIELVSVGKPLPDFELRIEDDDGRSLAEGEVGQVVVRGPSLMEGYLGQPEATRAVLRRGWLETGDLGFVLDGELYLTGRAKDVLIMRGRNHSPTEVEQAVEGVEGVRVGCAVAASWWPEGGEREHLLLLVEARREVDPSRYPSLASACARAARAGSGLEPDVVEVLAPGTLPRTSSGKLRRREALQRWLAGTLDAPQAVTPLRLAGAVARSTLAFASLARKRRRAG